MRRERSSKAAMKERSDGVVAFLRDKGGEASMRELCLHLGYSWPAQLEAARGVLIAMERQGLVVKSVRPSHETRVSYYSVAAPLGAFTMGSVVNHSSDGCVITDCSVFFIVPMLGDDDVYHPTWVAVIYAPIPDEKNGFEAGADSPSFCVWAVPGTHSDTT